MYETEAKAILERLRVKTKQQSRVYDQFASVVSALTTLRKSANTSEQNERFCSYLSHSGILLPEHGVQG
jgi:hypothetical protein